MINKKCRSKSKKTMHNQSNAIIKFSTNIKNVKKITCTYRKIDLK